MKYTKHNLKKIQGLLEEMGYVVRYEKGNFQSGYCIVEKRKIAIVNRFYDTEGRINVLLDILSKVGNAYESLSEDSQKLFRKLILQVEKEQEDENITEPTEEKEQS